MNIVHVGSFKKDSANGVNQCIYNISVNQAKLGHNVCVYSFEDIDKVKEEIKGNVKHIIFPKGKLKGFILNKKFIHYLYKNRNKIDLIHLHSVFLPINNSISKLLRKLNIEYVLTPHGGYSYKCLNRSRISHLKKQVYIFLFERKHINGSKKIHALNENEKKELVDFKINESKIITIPNGINKLNNITCKDINDSKNITFMGRLDMVHKGLDYLLEGFNLYVKKYNGTNHKLIIVGPDEKNHLKNLKKYVEDNNIQDYVVFKDRVRGKEKDLLLRKTDIFIHTSRWEGMPISLLEALSYGIPLIVSKETNIGDYIIKYNAGVVTELDKNSIAQAIESILDSDIKILSENAINLAESEFDWSINARKITEGYI